jgi:hypothetical protein
MGGGVKTDAYWCTESSGASLGGQPIQEPATKASNFVLHCTYNVYGLNCNAKPNGWVGGVSANVNLHCNPYPRQPPLLHFCMRAYSRKSQFLV